MALMVCPECKGTVSDKATLCPHCGFPIAKENADYSKIVFQGETIDVGPAIKRLHDENDETLAEFELIDAYSDTAIPYSENTTKAMMKMVIQNYKQIYGELPSCFLTSQPKAQPKCPTCGSTRLIKKGVAGRAIDGFVFGRLSVEGRAQFICQDCGYQF